MENKNEEKIKTAEEKEKEKQEALKALEKAKYVDLSLN